MTGRSKKQDFLSLLGSVNRAIEVDEPPKKPKPAPKLRFQEQAVKTDRIEASPQLPQDFVERKSHRKSGMPNVLFNRLLRGKFPVGFEIDLHGLSREESWAYLNEALDKSQGQRLRCARIIHGKGLHSSNSNSVLKPLVRHWLRNDQRILAYAEPAGRHGGRGAVLILLRAKRPAQ